VYVVGVWLRDRYKAVNMAPVEQTVDELPMLMELALVVYATEISDSRDIATLPTTSLLPMELWMSVDFRRSSPEQEIGQYSVGSPQL